MKPNLSKPNLQTHFDAFKPCFKDITPWETKLKGVKMQKKVQNGKVEKMVKEVWLAAEAEEAVLCILQEGLGESILGALKRKPKQLCPSIDIKAINCLK